jgi:hypothetical protein
MRTLFKDEQSVTPVFARSFCSRVLSKSSFLLLIGASVLSACSPASVQETKSASVAPHASAAPAPAEPIIADKPHLRLLSRAQYNGTIASIFGPRIVPILSFAPFERTDGLLAAGAGSQGVTTGDVETYQRGASQIARLVTSPEQRKYLLACEPANPKAGDKACAAKILNSIGLRVFRRPLAPGQLDDLVEKATSGADQLGDFYAGLSPAIEGLLVSPKMLFIDERFEPDPAHPGQVRLDAYSYASRLSFFLWNMPPDEALLKAAASGQLGTQAGRTKVVDAMLKNANFENGVRAFFDDMFGYDAFSSLAKDPQIYPAFTGAAVEDAREQTMRLVVDLLVKRKGDYRDLFTTKTTFISPGLAPLYREPTQRLWTSFEAPADSPRAGLLTQISFLALHSHPGRSSPTRRGKALREEILCQQVPRPPPNIDFGAVENPDPTLKTARDRLDFHQKNPVCAGCHKITDPMGLALENFDGSGFYRDTEKGAVIDASGSLDGKKFKDAEGLGQALHDHPGVPSCLVKRIYAYGTGIPVARENEALTKYFTERFASQGYQLPALMRMIALSNAFSGEGPAAAPAAEEKKTAAVGATANNGQQ